MHFLGIGFAALTCLGFSCSPHTPTPSLPSAHLADIHLMLTDPATGTQGISLTWSYPSGEQVSYFEIFQSARKDSLGHAVRAIPATDSPTTVMPIPDTTHPFTIYYAVRPVFVEATGQKSYGDTLPIDSITLSTAWTILQPAAGAYLQGRVLPLEVQTNSDFGVVLHITRFVKPVSAWETKLDTCLPLNACDIPIFGPSSQTDELVTEEPVKGDTIPELFCVLGTESFQGRRTGLTQSLGCSRYFRVNP